MRGVALVLLIAAGMLYAACAPAPSPAIGAAPMSRGGTSSANPAIIRLPERPDPQLDAVLTATGNAFPGTLGVAIKHLSTGAWATLNGAGRFRAASLYKLFVLYEAFVQIEAGTLNRDETVVFSREAFAREPYAEWPAGTGTSVSCALTAMVTQSNNAAAAMLVERLGGERRITADVQAIGLRQSVLTPDAAFTSPADIALLLEAIATQRAVSRAASEGMLALLGAQQRNDRLPLPLPLGVKVAHKTGELPKLRNEAGIVYAPSGAYLFVALASDAPSDAWARNAIVDLSRDVYARFDDLESYFGLSPRLAAEVFRVPTAKGQLEPLDDQWSETIPISSTGVLLADGVKEVNVREMVAPDLRALQQAATVAGGPFWVTRGHRAPSGTDRSMVLNPAPLGCAVQLPPRPTPTPGPSPARAPAPTPSPKPAEPPHARQEWLGTVVAIADRAKPGASLTDFASSVTGRWLIAHAWEYGFVLPPAESAAGQAVGYEPWALRWVGREMAAHLHESGYERNPTAIVTQELARAEDDLASSRVRDSRVRRE